MYYDQNLEWNWVTSLTVKHAYSNCIMVLTQFSLCLKINPGECALRVAFFAKAINRAGTVHTNTSPYLQRLYETWIVHNNK